MLGLPVIDVAIGLVFIYMVLALACSAAAEAVAGFMDTRTNNLVKGITKLLGEQGIADEFFKHPLIQALDEGSTKPSYIPAQIFSSTLIDILAPASIGTGTSIDGIKAGISAKLADNPSLQKALCIKLNEAGENLTAFKAGIESWFDGSMDRVSSRYKQINSRIVLGIAFLLTVLANADTIDIAKQLYRDPSVRQALIVQAQEAVNNPPDLHSEKSERVASAPHAPPGVKGSIDKLQGMGLKLGWENYSSCSINGAAFPAQKKSCLTILFTKLIGLVITALAVSLGAPFWFDILNKIISIRGVGKSPQEKQKASG